MPALIFVKAGNYRRRFDFFGLGRRYATQIFPRELAKALDQFVVKGIT